MDGFPALRVLCPIRLPRGFWARFADRLDSPTSICSGLVRCSRKPRRLRFRRTSVSGFPLPWLIVRIPYLLGSVGGAYLGPPKFFDASLHACQALKTPPGLHSLTKATVSCWLPRSLTRRRPDLAKRRCNFRGCNRLQGGASPLRPTWFPVYASYPLFGSSCYLLSASAGYATLGTGGWLDRIRQGLAPCKKRQASLGAQRLA